MTVSTGSWSDLVREQASHNYVEAARRKGLGTFSINTGNVQREAKLQNRVPLVCMALKSKKFLQANGYHLVSETGSPYSLTHVVYTFTNSFNKALARPDRYVPVGLGLRGALKDVFTKLTMKKDACAKNVEQLYGPGNGWSRIYQNDAVDLFVGRRSESQRMEHDWTAMQIE